MNIKTRPQKHSRTIMVARLLIAIVALFLTSETKGLDNRSFPNGFVFGAATSAYQVEGGWNASGKGLNYWDYLTHTTPQIIADGKNGDVACDSYHKYLEDVRILKELGVNYYRFSLSWTRILPTGYEFRVNPDGIAYYNNLINALLENNIQPFVTLFHWDTPYPLYQIGSWADPRLVDAFTNFARVAFESFGDRVKYWTTFNEPKQLCLKGGDYEIAALQTPTGGIEAYMCSDTILKAHASAYHLYNRKFRRQQRGSVGIVMDTDLFRPLTNSTLDIEAAERRLQFTFGWWANPIFSRTGNYPKVMIDRIAARSRAQGFQRSRLPTLSLKDILYIRGTADFLGLNHYTTSTAAHQEDPPIENDPSWFDDVSVATVRYEDFRNTTADGQRVGPPGFRSLLRWIKKTYNNPTVIVTENGYPDAGGTNDTLRVEFYQEYLSSLLEAVYDDRVNVKGYTAWSLIDVFEWFSGYTVKLGLYSVDFDDVDRPRTPKLSGRFYANLTATRRIPAGVTFA